MSRLQRVFIAVQEGNALECPADVLALKYAQSLYGVELDVYERLKGLGREPTSLPKPNGCILLNTKGCLGAAAVLIVGVVPLRQFGYQQIREFGRKVLSQAPDVEHLALTIHGPGYGLDEVEAFESELAGVVDALVKDDCPDSLERVSFIEQDPRRADRLREILNYLIPEGVIYRNDNRLLDNLGKQRKDTLRTAGYTSAAKPHIFVAMPFAESMEDVFHYGIQGAVKAAGFLCERADLTSFVGDVMEWVKRRISDATLVIADLTTTNPNVYLEVGYAWGCGCPTILLVRDTTAELKFDVKGHRCLAYKSIKHLEEILRKELQSIAPHVVQRDFSVRERRLGIIPTPPIFNRLGILVLDGSGSMSELAAGNITKAQAVNAAVRGTFTRLRRSLYVRNFSFAVVTFDESAQIHTPITAAIDVDDDGNYDPAENHGGATNIGTGLLEAKRIADDFLRKAPREIPSTVVIVVLSDGRDGESGAEGPAETRRIAEEIKRNPAITICSTYLTTVGSNDVESQEHLKNLASDPTESHYKVLYDAESLRTFFCASVAMNLDVKIL